MNPDTPAGRIVTFYSYKGGTGRSLILANVAWILASNGKRVLAVDWDLEAPGLHRYFEPFIADRYLTRSDGVIDLVSGFVKEAVTPSRTNDGDSGAWYEPLADIRRYAFALDYRFPRNGVLHFVPSGRQGASYATRVNSFDWAGFYERFGGGAFLEAVRTTMRKHYDYILIDSRTGVSDTSGICTVQMPDALVVCFTLNNQSIDGASAIARSVLDQRRKPAVRVLPVPMRIENSEKDKLAARKAYARRQFAHLPNDRPESDLDVYWSDVEVLYWPYYAYDEVLATFADRPGDRHSILSAAEQITRHLTEGEVVALEEPPSDAERQRVLDQFTRRGQDVDAPVVARFDVYLSYNPSDSQMVEDLAKLLKRTGLEPWLDTWQTTPGSDWLAEIRLGLEQSRTCAIVVGKEGLAPAQLNDLERALKRAKQESAFRVFPVLLPGAADYISLAPSLASRTAVDLRAGIGGDATAGFSQAVTGEPRTPSHHGRSATGSQRGAMRSADLAIRVDGTHIEWALTDDAGEHMRREEMLLSVRRRQTIDLLVGQLAYSTDIQRTAIDLEKTRDIKGEELYHGLLLVVGHELFDLLFVGELREDLFRALAQLRVAELDRLRIALSFIGNNEAWLASLPWEYTRTTPGDTSFDPRGLFLSERAELVLSRRLNMSSFRSLGSDQWPVRVLLVCSSPPRGAVEGLERVDAYRVQEHLKALEELGVVTLEMLIDEPPPAYPSPDGAVATRKAFQHKVLEFQPIVVHFIGHARCSNGTGELAFANPDGTVDWVVAERFEHDLSRSRRLKLVFLQACQSALPDPYVSFSGVARMIAASGVPAVVAMQYRITQAAANAFAEAFYDAIFDENPVSDAVQAARNTIADMTGNHHLPFGLPILYLEEDNVLAHAHAEALSTSAALLERRDQVTLACPRCGADLAGPEQKVCQNCGLRLICPEPDCGQRYVDPINDRFCRNCQAPVRQPPYADDAFVVAEIPDSDVARATLTLLRGEEAEPPSAGAEPPGRGEPRDE